MFFLFWNTPATDTLALRNAKPLPQPADSCFDILWPRVRLNYLRSDRVPLGAAGKGSRNPMQVTTNGRLNSNSACLILEANPGRPGKECPGCVEVVF